MKMRVFAVLMVLCLFVGGCEWDIVQEQVCPECEECVVDDFIADVGDLFGGD